MNDKLEFLSKNNWFFSLDEIIEWVERVSKIPVDDSKLQPEICVVEVQYSYGKI
jgi:hypothetical protein